MQGYAWCLYLTAVLSCRSTSPASPGAAVDPVLGGVLAAVDDALVARPTDGGLLYQRASLMIPLGARPADALRFLEQLDATGWDVALADADFAPLTGDARYRELAARIAARAPRVGRSAVAFSVPGNDLVPEGIAVDATTGTFYLGSLRRRTIVAIDPTGGSRRLVAERAGGLLGVTGMKVDPVRGVLWAASHASHSMADHQPDGRDTDGVYAFALDDGSIRRHAQFADPGPHLANDLAITADGTVYLTDSASGSLYRVPPGRDALERVLPPRSFAYPNGIALADEGRLYVADAIGITRVAIGTWTLQRVIAPPRVALGGIDGMVLQGTQIFAVQSSIGQPRIVAITVDGDRATGLTVLENSPEALEQPTTTCLWHGALYTIANSQLNAFGPTGPRPGRILADPRILRTPL